MSRIVGALALSFICGCATPESPPASPRGAKPLAGPAEGPLPGELLLELDRQMLELPWGAEKSLTPVVKIEYGAGGKPQ